ncbi:MAG TPA: sigma-70 family RNA polymerase sigma factor, partial [Thermoanaerobaculia bacterium]|nr:sigma-70 family RNA polymerase sigma factor [Thermoanaerobaculia bacterium]
MVQAIVLARVPPAEADDLVQEVFLTAMRKLSALRDDAAFGGWLTTIARTRAAGFYRSRAADHDELQEIGARSTQQEEQEARQVMATIRELPEAYRETLVLRLVEGMTGPEIAAMTGLTPESV